MADNPYAQFKPQAQNPYAQFAPKPTAAPAAEEPGILETPKQFAIGAGTGYALGIPEAVVGGVNWLNKTARHIAGQTDVQPALDPNYYSPIAAVQNLLFDKPPEGYEGARDAGNLVGAVTRGMYGSPVAAAQNAVREAPAIVARAANTARNAVNSAPDVVRFAAQNPGVAIDQAVNAAGNALGRGSVAFAKTAAPIAATTAGVEAGAQTVPWLTGAVGNAVGGDYGQRIGEDIGEMAGPGIGAGSAGMAANALSRTPRLMLGPDSQNIMAALDRLGLGDRASFGLVGNKFGQWLEDITTTPLMGAGPAARTRLSQHEGIGNAAGEAASSLRGGANPGPIDIETIGRDVQNAGTAARDRLQGEVTTLQEGLENRAGPGTASNRLSVIQEAERLLEDPTLGADKKHDLQGRIAVLRDPINAIPLDAELDGTLRAELTATQNALASDYARDPGVRSVLQNRLAELNQSIEQNTGVTYGALKDWREFNGKMLDGRPVVHPDVGNALYGPATQSMRGAAESQGVSPAYFDAVQAHTRSMYETPQGREGPLPIASDIASTREPGQAYSKLFGGKIPAVDTIDALRRPAWDETNTALANWYEQKMRGNTGEVYDEQTGVLHNPTGAFNRTSASNFMAGLSDAMKDRLSRSSVDRQRLDDINTVVQAERQRPTRSLPTGGTSITAPGIFAAMTGGAINTTGSVLSALGTGEYLTKPENVRAALGNPMPYATSFGQGVSRAGPAIIPRPQDEPQ